MTPTGGPALVERLRRLDAASVSDALDAAGRPGVLTGIRRLWPGPALAGPVITVALVPAEAAPPRPVHLGAAAIGAAQPGDVIVVDNGGRVDCGSWGGLLTLAAVQRGVAGVVTHGACRDVDEAQALGFPVFGLAATPLTARGRVAEHSTGTVVDIAGVVVRTGDLLIADGSGAVVIPAADAPAVITAAESIVAREAVMADRLRSGVPAAAVLGTGYEDMLRAGGPGS
ncbi:MAG TPA: demethylmenaquinone methyltransferase [Acidimicrobiia bacterium]|nr:demethylmenaquinone methyltransferase [Acidimicrobiia bacterium]